VAVSKPIRAATANARDPRVVSDRREG